MNLIETIKSNLNKMTKSEYAVAIYFLENPNSFVFETLDSIAKKINISTTSVLRFCRKNGFSGYKALQDEIRSAFNYQRTLPEKLKSAVSSETVSAPFPPSAANAIECIKNTFATLPEGDLNIAVDKIAKAKRVFCFGMRESFALAHYAYTRFLTVRSDVFILSSLYSDEIESVLSLTKNDVCIFFLFHRYTKQSLHFLNALQNQGVSIILITSPPFDEIADKNTILLPCYVDINGIKNSSAAPVCLTDHLANLLVAKSDFTTLEYMKNSEALFKKFTF